MRNFFMNKTMVKRLSKAKNQTICPKIRPSRERERKERLVVMMGGVCKICGFSGNLAAYDFHHPNENYKLLDISRGLRFDNSRFESEVVEEAKKCILLCANCHRTLHAEITEDEQ